MAAFFSDTRHAAHPVERAALLSGSFAAFRHQHGRYPFYASSRAAAVIPASVEQSAQEFSRLRPTKASEHVRRAVHRRLCSVRHPLSTRFSLKDDALAAMRAVSPAANQSVVPATFPAGTATDIRFDHDQVSTVTVRSAFGGVSRADAKTILDYAKPENWHVAVPTFFPEIHVGAYRNGRLDAIPLERLEDENHYQIQERVEWEWRPNSTGGIITILDIEVTPDEEFARESEPFVSGVIESIEEARRESIGEDEVSESGVRETPSWPSRKQLPEDHIRTAYKYALIQCVQSRLMSSWEVGGLDVDDGRYVGLWVPDSPGDDTGNLYVEAVKSIHYSTQADIFPGFSDILNLMAPSVESMIMNELAFDATLHFLEQRRSNQAPQVKARSAHTRKAAS